MEQQEVTKLTERFKSLFNPDELNALGKLARFSKRLREITPARLALSLIQSCATAQQASIADLQRSFNAMHDACIQYKPFHNQLAKRQFPDFVRLLLCRMLNVMAGKVLCFNASSPFARFQQICIQDGTSFAIKHTLSETFPGRFTTISPAAVELHVTLELLSESVESVVLSPDREAERQFLPKASQLREKLLLGDRGYFAKGYLQQVDQAGGFFIMRGTATMNPTVLSAIGANEKEIKSYRGKPLKALRDRLCKHQVVDMMVRFVTGKTTFDVRVIASPNPREGRPRYLLTNLMRSEFSAQQIGDGYRLRWQIELLFKEWKSHANLHAFDTSNAYLAEGLIWASICAATLKRHFAHAAQWHCGFEISTRKVAMSLPYMLADILKAILYAPGRIAFVIEKALNYLSVNAQRAHPKRDRKTGRAALGLEPQFGIAA